MRKKGMRYYYFYLSLLKYLVFKNFVFVLFDNKWNFNVKIKKILLIKRFYWFDYRLLFLWFLGKKWFMDFILRKIVLRGGKYNKRKFCKVLNI